MIFSESLEKIENYINSGDLAFEFEHAENPQRGEILDFLERIMDLADTCDGLATKLIFPNAVTDPEEAAKLEAAEADNAKG